MTADSKFMIDLVGNLGSIALVFWMVVRLTNHTIPRLADSFIKSTKEQRDDFKEILLQQREDLLRALDRQEQAHRDEVSALVDSLKEIKSELREAWK